MPKKLLLADDSVTIQKVIGISFANEDVTLVTVDNGDDAIAKTRELRPDLVLADVVMPGKTGYEVCEAIKSDPNLRHIPVLLLTGTFEAFDEERARQVGAAGHVAKPFEAQVLINQVNQLLAASDATPEQASQEAKPSAVAVDAAEIEAPTRVVAESADAGFDFFSDELDAADPISATPVAETLVSPLEPTLDADALLDADLELGSSLDLDPVLPGQDDAFSFGDEALQDLDAEPIASQAESTIAILPDDDAGRGFQSPSNDLTTFDTEFAEPDFATPAGEFTAIDADPIEQDSGAALAATPLLDDDLGSLSTDIGDVAPATVVDFGEEAGFDVSSSNSTSTSTSENVDSNPAPNQASLGSEASRAAIDAVVPKLREQLHDTLEKIAWESFGSITEEIVRQAVERVEAVAWEVVPQIAETLIQEEIRKMKGDE